MPAAIGQLAYPAIRAAGPQAIGFMPALTVGLLLYLFVDTLQEGLELGAEALGRLRGTTVVWVAMGLTAIALLAIGRRSVMALVAPPAPPGWSSCARRRCWCDW